MGTATAARRRREAGFGSAAEMREVLERLLERVNADERLGPMLRAARIRTRFEFPNLGLVLNVASADDELDGFLSWSFDDDPDWQPTLRLTMDSEVANAYLQGRQSLAVAIARGSVRCSCEARSALLFLPTVKLLNEPYRGLIEAEYPHLVRD